MIMIEPSEQLDTAKGKKMAQAKTTKLIHEGNIIKICVLSFVLLIAAWTAWGAYLGYSGTFPNLTGSANLLAALAGIQFSLFVGGVFLSRKM